MASREPPQINPRGTQPAPPGALYDALGKRVDDDTHAETIQYYRSGDLTERDLRRINRKLEDDPEFDTDDLEALNDLLGKRANVDVIDPGVDGSDLLDISDRGADLEETVLVAKRGSRTHWMENGDKDAGWNHIESRHIDGEYELDKKDGTSIFPTGEPVKGKNIPDEISESDVQMLIYESIKEGDATPQALKYYFEPNKNGYSSSGIDDMQVIMSSDGSVETAYPLSGPSVLKWVPGLNGGKGGFVSP